MSARERKGIRRLICLKRQDALAFGIVEGKINRMNEDLVLAVTTRECISLRGFTPRIELGMLEALQEETWFAQPAIIRNDPLAAEVRLALIYQHADHVLIDEQGRFAADQPLFPDTFAADRGLPGLKKYVQQLALIRLGMPCGCELAGYAFHPIDQPHIFYLVYRCRVVHATAVPVASGSWIPAGSLESLIRVPYERWLIPIVAK